MNGIPLRSVPAPDAVHYPSSDGEPLAETEVHVLVIIHLLAALRQHFAGRPDVYVIGNIFLYYEEGNPAARKSPDVMVVKGAEPKGEGERESFAGVTPAG